MANDDGSVESTELPNTPTYCSPEEIESRGEGASIEADFGGRVAAPSAQRGGSSGRVAANPMPDSPAAEEIPPPPAGESSLDLSRRSDQALVRTAVANRWPVPDDLRAYCVETLQDFARKKTVGPHIRLGAIRTLVAMEAQNATDERGGDSHLHLHANDGERTVIILPDNGRD